jgi:NTP pyrophosphatase (non-canonical NTP hydrolase)
MPVVLTLNHLTLQVREEAGELCQTLEAQEGPERAASEMADLLYHAMVLLNVQVRVWVFACLQVGVEEATAAASV